MVYTSQEDTKTAPFMDSNSLAKKVTDSGVLDVDLEVSCWFAKMEVP